jgi:hypothetical protein
MYTLSLVLNRMLQVFFLFLLSIAMELTTVSRFLDRLNISFTGIHHFYLGGFITFAYAAFRYLKAITSPVSEFQQFSRRAVAESTFIS